MSKPRVVKDYAKLSDALRQKLRDQYPYGFEKHLIRFKNHKNKFVSALPYEADDYYYLIRMTIAEAQEIMQEDIMDEDLNIEESVHIDPKEMED